MFKRILVPLDGSELAEKALPIAAHLARASQGTLILAHVLPPLNEAWAMFPSTSSLIQSEREIDLRSAEQYLTEVSQRSTCIATRVETVVLSGSPAATLLSLTQTYHIDIVVMNRYGRGGQGRWLMGKVAEKVVGHAPVPVFLLSSETTQSTGLPTTPARPYRALVPLDGSAFAQSALAPAAQLIAGLSYPQLGELDLLRVVTHEQIHEVDYNQEQTLERACASLVLTAERAEAELHTLHIPAQVRWSLRTDLDATEGIVHQMEQEREHGRGYDLLVLATHGRGALQRWFMGHTTGRILHTTDQAILIVRPPALIETQHPVAESLSLAVS